MHWDHSILTWSSQGSAMNEPVCCIMGSVWLTAVEAVDTYTSDRRLQLHLVHGCVVMLTDWVELRQSHSDIMCERRSHWFKTLSIQVPHHLHLFDWHWWHTTAVALSPGYGIWLAADVSPCTGSQRHKAVGLTWVDSTSKHTGHVAPVQFSLCSSSRASNQRHRMWIPSWSTSPPAYWLTWLMQVYVLYVYNRKHPAHCCPVARCRGITQTATVHV